MPLRKHFFSQQIAEVAFHFLWHFADGRSLPFHRFNFHRYGHTCPLCTVQSSLFHRFNFHGQVIIHENRKNWTPQKFPTIQYTLNEHVIIYIILYDVVQSTIHLPIFPCIAIQRTVDVWPCRTCLHSPESLSHT